MNARNINQEQVYLTLLLDIPDRDQPCSYMLLKPCHRFNTSTLTPCLALLVMAKDIQTLESVCVRCLDFSSHVLDFPKLLFCALF